MYLPQCQSKFIENCFQVISVFRSLITFDESGFGDSRWPRWVRPTHTKCEEHMDVCKTQNEKTIWLKSHFAFHISEEACIWSILWFHKMPKNANFQCRRLKVTRNPNVNLLKDYTTFMSVSFPQTKLNCAFVLYKLSAQWKRWKITLNHASSNESKLKDNKLPHSFVQRLTKVAQ